MTQAECDSTSEISFEDGSPHAYGCSGYNGPCTNSILRLALIAGSAYAMRFTTCVVHVNSPRRPRERTRHCPYQRKKKYGAMSGSVATKKQSCQEVPVGIVSTSTDFGLSVQDTRVETGSQVDVNFQGGTAESLGSEPSEQDENVQNLLKPLRITTEAQVSRTDSHPEN